jgi:hypothetical protein
MTGQYARTDVKSVLALFLISRFPQQGTTSAILEIMARALY